MSCVINIHSIKINSMASNASFNIGPAFHSSHSAMTQLQGSNASVGDQSPAKAYMQNSWWNPGMNNEDPPDNSKSDQPDKAAPGQSVWQIGQGATLAPSDAAMQPIQQNGSEVI